MAVIPKEVIFDGYVLKPTAFRLYCLFCQVRDKRKESVFLDPQKALKAGIKKSAYYAGVDELEKLGWIGFSHKSNGRKYWNLVKGFMQKVETNNLTEVEVSIPSYVDENSMNVEKESANVEKSMNAENSANVEKPSNQNSMNVEKDSANVENIPHTPYKEYLKEPTKKNPTKEEGETLAFTENRFIGIYHEFYPDDGLAIFPQEIITNRVSNERMWRKALVFWKGSNYRSISIPKLCDKYDELVEKEKNGKTSGYKSERDQKAEQEFINRENLRTRNKTRLESLQKRRSGGDS